MTEPKKVTVLLLAPHEHVGIIYPPGARLELYPDQAQWLIEQGRARSAELQTRKPKPRQED